MTESQRRWCNRGLLIWAYMHVFVAVVNIWITRQYGFAVLCLLAALFTNYVRRKDFAPKDYGAFKA